MSAELEAAIEREATSLASLAEPLDQVRAVNEFFAQLDFELEKVTQVRFDAIRELRAAGWSYNRIAAEAGISKQRVAQIARAAGMGGERAARG